MKKFIPLLLIIPLILLGSDRVVYMHLASDNTVNMSVDSLSLDFAPAESTATSFYAAFANPSGFSYADGYAALVIETDDTIGVDVWGQPCRQSSYDFSNAIIGLQETRLTNSSTGLDSLVFMFGDTLYPANEYLWPVGDRATGRTGWGPCSGFKIYFRWRDAQADVTDSTITFRMITQE